MHLIIIIILILLANNSYANRENMTNEKCWQSIIGSNSNDIIRDIQQTSQGNFIAIGTTNPDNITKNSDIWSITLDKSGRLLQEKTYGGENVDEGYALHINTDGSYILLGTTILPDTRKQSLSLIKVNIVGDMIWHKTYSLNYQDLKGLAISPAENDNYLVAGYAYVNNDKKWDAWIAKFNQEGNIIWEQTIGQQDHEVINTIYPLEDNYFLLAGYTRSQGEGKSDSWIIKINSQGKVIWEKVFGGKDYDEVYAIQATDDNGYLIVSSTSSQGKGYSDIWLVKIDNNGEKLWEKVYGGKDYDDAYSITRTHDHQFLLATTTFSQGRGLSDIWLLKIDNYGEIIWDYTIGGKDFDEAYVIRPTTDGGYILAGNTRSKSTKKSDGWIIKLNTEGLLDHLEHF